MVASIFGGGIGGGVAGGWRRPEHVEVIEDSPSLTYLRPRGEARKEEIVRLKQQYMQWHARRIEAHRLDKKYYDLQFSVASPDGRDPFILPTARSIVETITNHLKAEVPIFSVLPKHGNSDEKALKQSGLLTVFLNGVWQAFDLRSYLRELIHYDLVYGVHVTRLGHDPGAWPLKPEPPVIPADPDPDDLSKVVLDGFIDELMSYKRKKERYEDKLQDWKDYTEENLPIQLDVLNPMYCFWEPTRNPRKIVLAWERTIADVLQEFPDLREKFWGADVTKKIQYCAYCDEEIEAAWIESFRGKAMSAPDWVIDPQEHHYGFFPYEIDGPWKTPAEESDEMYPSIYKPLRALLQYESTLATQMAHLFRATGYAPLIIKTEAARSNAQKPTIDMSPGKANYLEPDEEAYYLELGGNSAALAQRLIDGLQGYMQDASGLSEILKGGGRASSGYQQAQKAQMARVALVPEEHSIQRNLEKVSKGILKMIRTAVRDKVTLIGPQTDLDSEVTVGPKDVVNHGRIEVQLKTVLPIDESAKIANYAKMQDKGWIPSWEAARLAGIRDPLTMHAQWDAEQIANEPEIKRAKTIQYLQEHDPELLAIVQQIDQQHAMQAQQQQGAGGGPPQGGGPAPMGQPHPPAPGGAREQELAQRQAQQGGAPPGRLPKAPQGAQGP